MAIAEGREEHVVRHVAAALAGKEHRSLITELTRALLSSDDVDELWADDDDLKELIQDLGR